MKRDLFTLLSVDVKTAWVGLQICVSETEIIEELHTGKTGNEWTSQLARGRGRVLADCVAG